MGIGSAAVEEGTVPGDQRKSLSHVFQSAVAGQDLEKQTGGKIFPAAFVGLSGFQKAGFLQMDQTGSCKCRRSVKDSAGSHQAAVEKGCTVHRDVSPCGNSWFFSIITEPGLHYKIRMYKKVNIMLVLFKILS